MSQSRELTRAELVRARRAQRVNQAMKYISQRGFKPVAPVTSRLGTSYVQPRQKSMEGGRFNTAFGLPFIALRQRSIAMPRARGSWRLASFLSASLCGVALYFMWTLPYFHVPSAIVFGNNRLSVDEINAVLGLSGQSVFLVQPEDLTTRLRLNYPELASVEINAYLPNLVYVNVSERQPVILWQQGDGFTWIDAEGIAFRPHGQANGLVPVIGRAAPPAGAPLSGDLFDPPQYMQRELVDAILVLAPHVPADSVLTYDPNTGLGWKDSRGWDVFFGTNLHDMPVKLKVYQSLVDTLTSSGRIPEFISVAYPDAPYYRMTEFSEIDGYFESGQ